MEPIDYRVRSPASAAALRKTIEVLGDDQICGVVKRSEECLFRRPRYTLSCSSRSAGDRVPDFLRPPEALANATKTPANDTLTARTFSPVIAGPHGKQVSQVSLTGRRATSARATWTSLSSQATGGWMLDRQSRRKTQLQLCMCGTQCILRIRRRIGVRENETQVT